jgi:hypothetical protein
MFTSGINRRHASWLRFALAFIWLATGLGYLHPYYREVGANYLTRLGLPSWVMAATCVFEIVLGLRLLWAPAGTWLTLLQAAMIGAFTLILAVLDPAMMASPYGMLTKNVPLVSLVAVLWLVERNGWTPAAVWTLRAGMASIWLLEGLLPCLLFPQPKLRELLTVTGMTYLDPNLELRIIGALQILLAVGVVVLSGWPLRMLLVAQLVGLVVISTLAAWSNPQLLVHPFGPVTKNVCIFIGTALLGVTCRLTPPPEH